MSSRRQINVHPKQSKGLIRSLNRRAVRDDKSPRVAHKIVLHEPIVCARCGAVFLRKTWGRDHALSEAQIERRRWGFCPACQQVSRLEGQGRLVIKGSAAGKAEAKEQRIHNVAKVAAETQPERRVVPIEICDGCLEVTTTSQRLAHRFAY